MAMGPASAQPMTAIQLPQTIAANTVPTAATAAATASRAVGGLTMVSGSPVAGRGEMTFGEPPGFGPPVLAVEPDSNGLIGEPTAHFPGPPLQIPAVLNCGSSFHTRK